MKNLIYSTIALFLFSFSVMAGNKKGKVSLSSDSLYCIEIDGQVLIPKDDSLKAYKIELLCHNTVVDSGIVVDNESFLLKVKKNSWYTIRIIKQGYFPLVVSIDTKLPEHNSENHKFHFDTELIKESYVNIQDDDAVDFPIAIVSYDKSINTFSPIKQYSSNIRKSLFEIVPVKEGYAKVD